MDCPLLLVRCQSKAKKDLLSLRIPSEKDVFDFANLNQTRMLNNLILQWW